MENEPIFREDTNNNLSENCRAALSTLVDHFKNNNSRILCQKFKLLSHVRNVTNEEQWIYIANLCTLVEERWFTRRSLPSNGNETCSNSPVGDIWQDYEFNAPKTTVLNAPALSNSRDLDKTRRREKCSKCPSSEQIECTDCKGQRSLILWSQLNVKWFNNSSEILFPFENQRICPGGIIQAAKNKIKCLEFDDAWPSTSETLDGILNKCDNLPEEFRNEMNNKFLLHKKSDKILRLKCIIERLRIDKIDYQLNGLQNQTFTFYIVGEDKKLYAAESSYPNHNQQCKTQCSLM